MVGDVGNISGQTTVALIGGEPASSSAVTTPPLAPTNLLSGVNTFVQMPLPALPQAAGFMNSALRLLSPQPAVKETEPSAVDLFTLGGFRALQEDLNELGRSLQAGAAKVVQDASAASEIKVSKLGHDAFMTGAQKITADILGILFKK